MVMKSEEMVHSPFGPSSMARNETCPGNIRAVKRARESGIISEKEPDNVWSLQGQKEHDMAYGIMRHGHDMKFVSSQVGLENDVDAQRRVKFSTEVVQKYIDDVDEESVVDPPVIEYEIKLDPKEYFTLMDHPEIDPDLFPLEGVGGTCDVMLLTPDLSKVTVIDYKFGRSEVEVEQNIQLGAYGLGAIAEFVTRFGFYPSRLELVIVQPQASEPVTVYEMDKDGIYKFAHRYFNAVRAAMMEDAPLRPGCCNWCPLDGQCRAQQEEYRKVFKDSPVEEIPYLSEEELGMAANSVKEIKRWIAKVEDACTSRQLMGKTVPGRKLIRKIKRRRWVDEEKADKFLANQKVPVNERRITKLASPSQAEKLLRSHASLTTRGWNNFNNLWEAPKGDIISVPEDAKGDPLDPESLLSPVKNEADDVDIDDIDIDDII